MSVASELLSQYYTETVIRSCVGTSPPEGVRSVVMSVSVRLSVCLSVCPLAHLENHMSKLHRILYTRYSRLWLGRFTAAMRYVLPVLWIISCVFAQLALASVVYS